MSERAGVRAPSLPMPHLPLLALLCLAAPLAAQERPPVFDVHLHALGADAQGPPPLGMCTPMEAMPAWDPATDYAATFMAFMKDPPCDDPVWSPESDEELLRRTLEVMERQNVAGVLSGEPDRVRRWMAAAPGRFLPGSMFNAAATDVDSHCSSRTCTSPSAVSTC